MLRQSLSFFFLSLLSLLLVIVGFSFEVGGAFSLGVRVGGGENKREVFSDCESSTSAMYDHDYCGSSSTGIPPLMNRLVEKGVPLDQMNIWWDDDDNDNDTMSMGVTARTPLADSEEKKENLEFDKDARTKHDAYADGRPTTVVEIKTLIWEVVQSSEGDDDLENKCTFYIATASKLNDKIQVSALRSLVDEIEDNNGLQRRSNRSSFRLNLAPRHMAESLSGFQSGCMPPIGHTIPMQLFMDESIISPEGGMKETKMRTASIGSGIMGRSLMLPLSEFIKVARESEKGVVVGSFVQGLSSPDSDEGSRNERGLSPNEIRQQRKMERMSRWPEPKDRLDEFRKFNDTVDKLKLFRSTARKQGRVEEMKALVEEAVTTGVFPQLFKISIKDGIGKNALHICAWRGDFETVKLIVETAEVLYPTLDLVNVISEGQGNYGKTPIFFALTQCREDVVRYLVAHGADLLIVDNKGQTPCSIAVSHLSDSACQFLFEAEARQLQAGGIFKNYRATHSDGKLYGDLDPRFPIDDVNIGGGEIADEILAYEASVSKAPLETIINGMPSQFQPRSLRPTVRWWIREARSLVEANESSYVPGEDVTFTQPRLSSRKKGTLQADRSPSPVRQENQLRSFILDELPRLIIEDIWKESEIDISNRLVMVNGMESLYVLEEEVDESLHYISDPNTQLTITYDEIVVRSAWAIDCEWKPDHSFGVGNPVATLQLSTTRKAFLVDVQSICQDFRACLRTSTALECQLDRTLSKIFASTRLPLLGYGVLQDLSKLAASFPHLKCFADYADVIDLQTVASVVYPKGERHGMSSLQNMAARLLGKRLDKTEQCSNWTQRPLSQSQLDYALLDAAVLPRLLNTMMKESSLVEGYNGQFFKIHSHLLSNIRYRQIGPPPENQIYNIPMGTIKRLLGQQFVRQCWPSTEDEPGAPRLVPIHVVDKKHTEVPIMDVGEKCEKRPKAVQLKTLAGNLGNLPIPGVTLGFTKDSCVLRVIGHRLMNTLPEGTRVGFNRKAGVVETSNAWILFCNFESKADSVKTYSQFFEGGRHLSFRLNPNAQSGKSSESGLYRQVMGPRAKRDDNKRIVLFVREGTRSKYVYCGFCKCLETSEMDDGGTRVLFELLDYDELIGETRIASDFVDLVTALHRRTANLIQSPQNSRGNAL